MEEVTEGSNPVTKNAKPGESMDTSKGGASKVITVTSDSMEGAKGTKNAGKSAAAPVGKAPVPSTKPSDASAKMEETESNDETIAEEETSETKYDFTQDVDALVSGEELSEEFRVKAATIFEAAVTARVNEESKALQEAFEESLTEEVEKIKTDLAEKVDDYVSYATKQWIEENALAVEHGIKNEMAESFFNGLKDLYVEHNFTVPEEKFNLLDGMTGELDEMETKLNEQIDTNIALQKRIGEYTRMEIVNDAATGLAETQKEKLASLAEGVEFENEEDFRNKIETIKESYFTRKAEVAEEAKEPTEEASQPLVESNVSGTMGKYVDALARWSK
ncbi:scaffold prohead core protein [Prochlorococcus phage P-SSM4]|nr:head scaffolding protein [Prochlorococcus phage P-SSM4]AAX46908.1 scaffold prohead core protein [Prochlorococcus phage P-SSM4]